MAWFNFLKAEGYFDPENNPDSVKVEEGFQIPYWEVLGYLEKLSIEIGRGNETELTEELLAVIKNVSEHPKDNYRTWYSFIKILSNLPNEKIPTEVLNYIPVWLSGKFDTMLQTSELCDKLLPKFLNDHPTKSDIEKAELILHYLFQVEKSEIQEVFWDDKGEGYRSRLYLHFLSDKFVKGDSLTKVVKYCSSTVILDLGRTIKFLLLDYPGGVNTLVKDSEKEYQIKIHIDKENLLVQSRLKDNEDALEKSILANWEDKSEEALKQELVSIMKQHKIDYIPGNDDDDTFQRLNFALNTDLTSAFGFNSIRKLDDIYSNDEKVLNVFSLIFRELLDEKAKQNPVEAMSLLKTFCYDKRYRMPFYKRIALYVICENWGTTKSVFWELVKNNDALHLFSIYKYQKELYDLLHRNQQEFEKEEKKILQNIINQGEQGEANEHEREDYWQLRWYAALKDITPFEEKYRTLSNKLKITNVHFESLGEVTMKSGSVSPISKSDLLLKSNQDIAAYIKGFKPKDRWEDPNISGLSDMIGRAVEAQPEKFADELELYHDIGYIYSYSMLNAFSKAWKQQMSFDWAKVLNFCLQTLVSDKFYSEQLRIETDTWNANSKWVVGSIASLLTSGLQNDENAINISLLPIMKEIIQIMVSNLERVDDFKENGLDYPNYSVNSTAGKVLRALFDYSLYRARKLFKPDDNGKWESDMRSLYETALQKGIIDAYVLEGMYFRQFYFLDKNWITEQVRKYYKIEDREWRAFMGGLAFNDAHFKEDLYILFYPHYERAIDSNVELKSFHHNVLVRHLTSFYFWKYETLSSEKLLFKFINQSKPDGVGDLISFIGQQKDYPKSLSEAEQHEFRHRILELWQYLADKYENSSIEEEQKNLGNLANWIVFASSLDMTYSSLILKSCNHIDKTFATRELLKNLVTIKNNGDPSAAALAIGEIISCMNFKDYIADVDKDLIKELVSFLYAHSQDKVASKFCNKLASDHQHYFLREIYERNMEK